MINQNWGGGQDLN